jgi:hypothetical protein
VWWSLKPSTKAWRRAFDTSCAASFPDSGKVEYGGEDVRRGCNPSGKKMCILASSGSMFAVDVVAIKLKEEKKVGWDGSSEM